MEAQLICQVRKNIITMYGEQFQKSIIINNTKVHTPNNTIHLGKKCFPINFYTKNGRYDLEMSEMRKNKLSRLDIISIKEVALNNVQTLIDLNKLK